MSQQELEQTDQEVMNLVNRSASMKVQKSAGEWFQEETQQDDHHEEEQEGRSTGAMDAQWTRENKSFLSQIAKQTRIHLRNRMIFCVVLCILIAAALVAAWAVPKLVIWVVNIGVLSCGITAGIAIDRFIRRWRL